MKLLGHYGVPESVGWPEVEVTFERPAFPMPTLRRRWSWRRLRRITVFSDEPRMRLRIRDPQGHLVMDVDEDMLRLACQYEAAHQ